MNAAARSLRESIVSLLAAIACFATIAVGSPIRFRETRATVRVDATACRAAASISPAPARRFRIRSTRSWFAEYAAKTGVKINYQDIGSGGGIKQLSEQTVDFGASRRADDRRRAGGREGRPGLSHPDGRRRRRDRVQPSRRSRSRSSSPGRSSPTSSLARSPSGMTRASRRSIPAQSFPRATFSSCIAARAAARRSSSPTISAP